MYNYINKPQTISLNQIITNSFIFFKISKIYLPRKSSTLVGLCPSKLQLVCVIVIIVWAKALYLHVESPNLVIT